MAELLGTLVITALLVATTTPWWEAVRLPFKVALGLVYMVLLLAALAARPVDKTDLVALGFVLLLIAATTPLWAKAPKGIKVALRVLYLLWFLTQAVTVMRRY